MRETWVSVVVAELQVYLDWSFGSPNISQRHTCSAARDNLIGCVIPYANVQSQGTTFFRGSLNYEDEQETLDN